MNFLKKFLLFYLHYFIKVINIFAILIMIFLGILLYVIIFEVPINFFNKYITEKMFNNLLHINNIYLKWDYNIKKPIIILNDVKYNNPEKKIYFSFKSIGIGFDISKLIVKKKFYPIYINLKGFELYSIRYKNNTFAFNLTQFNTNNLSGSYNYQPKNTLISALTKGYNTKLVSYSENANPSSFLKDGIFDTIIEYKKKYDFLSMLNRIDIDSSIIKFRDETISKEFKVDFESLNLTYDILTNKIVLESRSYIKDIDSNTITGLKGVIIADSQKNIFFNYSIDNLPLNVVLLYFNKDLTKDIKTSGLPIFANIVGKYQFPFGFKSLKSSIEMSQGELFIKNILSDKIGIKNINTQIDYDITNAKVNVQHFGINFSNMYPLKLIVLNNGELPLKNINFNAVLDLSKQNYSLSNVNINILDKKFIGRVNYSNQNVNFIFNTADQLSTSDVNKIWPNTFNSNIRKWWIHNVHKGDIDKGEFTGDISIKDKKFSLNNILGTLVLSNLRVNYLESMPEVIAPKAILVFDNKKLNIKYFNAMTANIFSENGEVTICDEFPSKKGFFPNIIVNSKVYSSVVDGLLFINNKPLYLLNKTHLKADRFSGVAAGTVYLEYSFTNKKVYNKNINLVCTNVLYKKAFKNKDLTNVNAHLNVFDSYLTIYGHGNYFETPLNLYINSNWNEKIPYSLKLTIEANNVSVNKLEELDLLTPFLKHKLEGKIDISSEFQQLKKTNKQFIKANLNLTNTHIHPLTFLKYSKNYNSPLRAIVDLSFIDNKFKEITQLSLQGKDINSQMRICLNDDKSINVIINKLILNKYANVKGYLYLAPNNMNMNIVGPYLNIGWVLDSYKKYSKFKQDNEKYNKTFLKKDTSSQPYINNINSNYVIRVNVNKAESNNVVINNFYMNLDLLNKNVDSLVISGDLENDENITIVYDKHIEKLAYNISNLGIALKFFNISTKLKRGNVNGQIDFIQNKENYFLTDGIILIKNFALGVIPFSSVRVSFTGRDLDFNIIDMSLKGNVVGGSLSGKYNGRNQYLMLSGYITPIWSASHMLANIPILGDFLKSNFAQSFLSSGVNKKGGSAKNNKGAINIPFNIQGSINNLQYQFSNPTKEQLNINEFYTNTNDN